MSRLILHCCLQGFLLLALLSKVSESTVRVYIRYNTTYISYYYTSYGSIGRIIGGVIGALCSLGFFIGVIVCACCIRRRRALKTRQAGNVQISMDANGAPVTSASGDPYPAYPKHDGISYVVSQPPPPYQEGMAPPGIGYPGQPQQPPYPQQPQRQQPPYPMQPPPVYPQPAATHDEQKF